MLLRIEIYINVYNNCSISMKSFTNREQYRIQTSEPIKFKKIKNEETKDKQLKKAPLERIYVQDK